MQTQNRRIGALALLVLAACSTDGTDPTAPRVRDTTPLARYEVSDVPGATVAPRLGVLADFKLSASTAGSILLNGSFESNGGVGSSTFQDWSVVNQPGSGNWFVQTGTTAPPGGAFAVPAPTDGNFAAMTNQPGPGSHILYQDIAVPAGGAWLTFDLFIGNRSTAFFMPSSLSAVGGFPNQQFRMDVVDPALPINDVAGVLMNVYRTAPGHPLVVGYNTVTANLSAFAGQTVRLRFTEVDNQLFFQAGVDNAGLFPAVRSVTGSGHLNLPNGRRTFAFSGVKSFTNGAVDGNWQVNNRDARDPGDAALHLRTSCVDGFLNEAWVGGVVTHDAGGLFAPGTPAIFRAIDNGEGGKAAPDQVSLTYLYPGGGISAICANLRLLASSLTVLPIDAGNVQVRTY